MFYEILAYISLYLVVGLFLAEVCVRNGPPLQWAVAVLLWPPIWLLAVAATIIAVFRRKWK